MLRLVAADEESDDESVEELLGEAIFASENEKGEGEAAERDGSEDEEEEYERGGEKGSAEAAAKLTKVLSVLRGTVPSLTISSSSSSSSSVFAKKEKEVHIAFRDFLSLFRVELNIADGTDASLQRCLTLLFSKRRELASAFSSFDADGDGTVTTEEFAEGMRLFLISHKMTVE